MEIPESIVKIREASRRELKEKIESIPLPVRQVVLDEIQMFENLMLYGDSTCEKTKGIIQAGHLKYHQKSPDDSC